ncbi:MAG: hypothetical protein WC401_04740 [Bacteroidales bacterium]|jgi:hypothetical protein|nr:hypothetical protein [Bacteroidales bacterium]
MASTTKILLVISAVVLALVPVANLFVPYASSFSPDVDISRINPASDPNYLYRLLIISAGLALTIISLLVLVISLFIKKYNTENKLANLSIFIFVYVVGWMFMPYWANGLFYVFSEGTSSLYDPKSLLPMNIIGEIWRIPILLLYGLLLVYLASSFIWVIISSISQRKAGTAQIIILIFNLLVVASYFFSPHYFYWLLD